MDLQTISSQMKVVIQKHQIVVTEMRNDPQNPVLQKRLHDLQLEIHTLNERQKQVVEDLRKNFGKKHVSPNSNLTNNVSGIPASTSNSPPQKPNQDLKMVCCAQKCPVTNHKIQTTTMITKPAANSVNTVRQTVPASLNNISTPTATITFKAPVGTVVLPNCSTGNALLSSKTTADHPKMHPVLVVPSPSNRSVDGPQTGVLLNLVPPIRVPQYPPPCTPRAPGPLNCQRPPVVNNALPATVSTPSLIVCTSSANESTSESSVAVSVNVNEKPSLSTILPIKTNKIDQKKKEFITALGLVSRDSLSEIKNKKLERKRRSTANPQFSNAALEEKWKNAAAAQAACPQQKRPRGRPRLETKPMICPTNGIPTISESPKTEPSPPPPPPDVSTIINSTSISESPPLSDSLTLVNGIHRLSSSEDAKNVEQMLSGLCVVCTQSGDLVKCDTCATQQHPGCMQPPLITKPQGPWQCNDCQSRTVSLTVVQSYEALKATKEDEKRKLLKKSLELRLKRSQLEGRLLQLKELSGKQKNRQSELQTSMKNFELRVEHIHSVISDIKMCS